MKKQTTYKMYTDPSHGWLAVKRSELMRLEIINEISSFSYQKGDTVYLEEDSDVWEFTSAKKALNERVAIETKHTNKSSPIRSYEPFQLKDREKPYWERVDSDTYNLWGLVDNQYKILGTVTRSKHSMLFAASISGRGELRRGPCDRFSLQDAKELTTNILNKIYQAEKALQENFV